MSKKILFEELVARREQREADKLKIGELRIPGTDRTLEARMPSKKAVLELYGEMQAANTPLELLECGKHALYAVCPQLQDKSLQEALGVAEDPMAIVDALFSEPEQDLLGGRALRFLGLIPSDVDSGDTQPDTASETVKN